MKMEVENENFLNSDTFAESDEIQELFTACNHVFVQSLGPKYILHISATSETNPYVAAALSDCKVDVFSLSENRAEKLTQLTEHTSKLCDCKFSPDNNALLYTASTDGTVRLWDLRQSKESAVTFLDTTTEESDPVKPLISFDVSPCNRLLAAGTEVVDADAFILFWDIRNTKLLGAYWESHMDDITQVKFHPEDSNKLMSGSTDGLINIYDLSQSSEDDALLECLNTEALVENLEWFKENSKDRISCSTSTNNLQLWELDSAEPYKCFKRSDLAEQILTDTDNVYIVKTHPVNNSLLVLCGSVNQEETALRSFQINKTDTSHGFRFSENKQRVRASWLNEYTNLLITGGEKGQLDIWKPDFSVFNFKSSKKK